MLGGKKEAAIEEKVTMNFAFASVVSIKKINKGDVFTKNNIWVKRPGNGEIAAKNYTKILGKVSKTDIESDIPIKYSDVDEK